MYDERRFSTVTTFLDGFEGLGLTEREDRNPAGYEGHPKGVMISLTPIWGLQLERLELKKEETEVFSESIGRLAGLSVLAIKKHRAFGLKSFKILMAICNKAANNDNKITVQECKETYENLGEPLGKMYQMFSYDNQKVPAIRFIKSNDGRIIEIVEEAMLAYRRIHDRTLRFIRSLR